MADSLAEHYIENALEEFRGMKALADKAVAQVSDEEFFRAIDPESNSIAVIMKHMAGNMRSRWTDFLNSDGEKPDRQRDTEFELETEDLMREVTIRREPHTIVEAVNRQLAHYGEHVGQIIFLAKHLKSSAWRTLSIPRGQSAVFNKKMEEEHA